MSTNSQSAPDSEYSKQILPHHRELLRKSAIPPSVANARGYESVDSRKRLRELGFHPRQGNVPGLAIPIHGPDGKIKSHLFRPDMPRIRNGHEAKYELPKRHTYRVGFPVDPGPVVNSTVEPLWIVDDPRSADALASRGHQCIWVNGYQGWRRYRSRDKPIFAEWAQIPLSGREVVIAFGSNVHQSPKGRADSQQLAAFLESKGATVQYAVFPPGPNGERVGADDMLAGGKDPKGYLVASSDPASPFSNADESWSEVDRFLITPEGTYRISYTEDGPQQIPLANFSARVVRQLCVTDGIEEQIEFELEVNLKGIRKRLSLSAEEFERMAWPLKCLGAEAIIRSGYNVRDELREAIQRFSGEVPKGCVYTHLGWTQWAGKWMYLHAGGAISPNSWPVMTRQPSNRDDRKSPEDNGLEADVPKTPILEQGAPDQHDTSFDVRVPSAFRHYELPPPSNRDEVITDVCAALNFLDLGPDRIVLPLFAAVFRAAMDSCNFSIFLVGESGVFKSELALLVAQFFGKDLTIQDLRTWNSTANALAALASHAKDTVMVIDDFIPVGSQGDIMRKTRLADDLLRAQANKSARDRARGDGSLREGKPSRCLIISTGEVLPSGHSLNARILGISLERGDIFDSYDPIKMDLVNRTQAYARQGCFARAMAAFLASIAPKYDEERDYMHDQMRAFRDLFCEEAGHSRQVDIAANLLAGLDTFLYFASTINAITDAEFEDIWQRAHDALRQLLEEHRQVVMSEDPCTRFLELLSAALHCGQAHLKLLDQDDEANYAAGSPAIWGYAERRIHVHMPSLPESERTEEGEDETETLETKTVWTPRGQQIGWKSFDNIYLDPATSLALANRFARQLSVPQIPFAKKALGKKLVTKRLIATHEKDRNTLKRNIEGVRREVFHLRTFEFVEIHYPLRDEALAIEEELEAERNGFDARQSALWKLREERDRELFNRRLPSYRKLLRPDHEANP